MLVHIVGLTIPRKKNKSQVTRGVQALLPVFGHSLLVSVLTLLAWLAPLAPATLHGLAGGVPGEQVSVSGIAARG